MKVSVLLPGNSPNTVWMTSDKGKVAGQQQVGRQSGVGGNLQLPCNWSKAARTSNYKRKPLPHNGALSCLFIEGWACLFIEHAVKNLYYWWNTTKLWYKWTTGERTRDKTDSLRVIKQQNSWTTWKATSDSARAGNHRAKTTSVGSAKTAPSGLKQRSRGTADWNITGSATKVAKAKRRWMITTTGWNHCTSIIISTAINLQKRQPPIFHKCSLIFKSHITSL